MSRPFKLDESSRAALVQRWREGGRAVELAREFGVSTVTVWKTCERKAGPSEGGLTRHQRRCQQAAARRREKAQRRGEERRSKARRDARIVRRWMEGVDGPELARRFGLSKATISAIVAGSPRPRRYGDPEDVAWPHPRRQSPQPSRPSRRPPIVATGSLPPRELAPRGSAHGRAKLDEPTVARIKRAGLEGRSAYSLAREHGVSDNTIGYILNGKTWTHVQPAPPANGGTA